MAIDTVPLEASVVSEVLSLLQPLEEVLEVRFDIWTRSGQGEYSSALFPLPGGEIDSALVDLCEAALFQHEPLMFEEQIGKRLLVASWPVASKVPLLVSAELDEEKASIASQLLTLTMKDYRQSKRIESLRLENGAYLQQLNEDMEELVFLRSMADRLALGGMSLSSDDLLRFVLPKLGQAAGVEEIHFVDGRHSEYPEVSESWILANCQERVDVSVIEQCVDEFRHKCHDQPFVKNYFQETKQGLKYPGINEFALVPVCTNMTTLGWLIIINRHVHKDCRHEHPVWKLGNNELGTSEVSLISTTAAMLASYTHNAALFDERESLLLSVVRTLVSAIESRDEYTCGHSERVARYAKRLARELGYDQEGSKRIYLTGLLHDIGKIGLSDSVLKKKGPLTEEEFAEIKRHPDLGWAILRELEPMDYVLPGVLHHHERFDGAGYPDGLTADATPLEGRLLAVVDAFDAMTSDRPYRKGMPWEKAVSVLLDGAGTQWDDRVVEKFVAIMPEILLIRENYRRPPLPVRKQENPRDSSGPESDNQAFDLNQLLKGS